MLLKRQESRQKSEASPSLLKKVIFGTLTTMIFSSAIQSLLMSLYLNINKKKNAYHMRSFL